jgi:hypothetical protein
LVGAALGQGNRAHKQLVWPFGASIRPHHARTITLLAHVAAIKKIPRLSASREGGGAVLRSLKTLLERRLTAAHSAFLACLVSVGQTIEALV